MLINRKNAVLLHDKARPLAARMTQEKNMELGQFYSTRHKHLTRHQPDYSLYQSLQNALMRQFLMKSGLLKTLSDQNQRNFAQKVSKLLPDEWTEIIANTGEDIII